LRHGARKFFLYRISLELKEAEMGEAASTIKYALVSLICCFVWLAGGGRAGAYELVVPVLEFRQGPFATSGIPRWNGYIDYLTLLNERDGGINGVRIKIVRCETGYDLGRGIECYKKLKKQAVLFDPGGTPIAYYMIDQSPVDKVPILSPGFGRAAAADGRTFKWAFNFPTSYWSMASIIIKYIEDRERGPRQDDPEHGGQSYDAERSPPALKGRKIGLVYLNSAMGREPIPVLSALSRREGFELLTYAVDAPGLDQKAIWRQIRQDNPDWLLLVGYGLLNNVALKEAIGIGFPMDHFIGSQWSSAESDLQDETDAADGYLGIALHAPGAVSPVHDEIVRYVYDAGKAVDPGFRPRIGEVYYNRGLAEAMWATEAIAKAMEIHKKKEVTGEDVRDGLEALDITDERLEELGVLGMLAPLKVTCANHEGIVPRAAVQQWDARGQRWRLVSRFYSPDYDLIKPLIAADAEAYAKAKGIVPRACRQGQPQQ
jgi:branched-chain amino acid transport system substrate-binding protein